MSNNCDFTGIREYINAMKDSIEFCILYAQKEETFMNSNNEHDQSFDAWLTVNLKFGGLEGGGG